MGQGGEDARPVSLFLMLGFSAFEGDPMGAFTPLRGFRGKIKKYRQNKKVQDR